MIDVSLYYEYYKNIQYDSSHSDLICHDIDISAFMLMTQRYDSELLCNMEARSLVTYLVSVVNLLLSWLIVQFSSKKSFKTHIAHPVFGQAA